MPPWPISEMCQEYVSQGTRGNKRPRKCQRKRKPGSKYCTIHQPAFPPVDDFHVWTSGAQTGAELLSVVYGFPVDEVQ